MSKAASLALSRLAPNWTYSKVEDLLLTPKSRKPDLSSLPNGIRKFKIDTKQGELAGYQLGSGPAVILVHGWSGGAYQFFPLMRGLAQIGFRAIAFDHFAHGHSSGKQASLQSFVNATESVIRLVKSKVSDGIVGIVGHSLGCNAIANTDQKLIGDAAIMLISPIFDMPKFFAQQIQLPGLHPDLAGKYMARLEQKSKLDYERMSLVIKLLPYDSQTVIAHDKSDRISSFNDSAKFCAKNPLTKLNITNDLGHERIINSESVWQQLKSHLNYEDITVNPF